MWVPSHVGLSGNCAADAAAKAALNLTASAVSVPFTDFQARINCYVKQKWQREWDGETNNKLHAIEPVIHGAATIYKIPRRDDILIHRLRLGHTYAMRSYLLKGENAPQCAACGGLLTVEHLLVSCGGHAQTRRQFYVESTLRAVFNNVSPRKIVDFTKAIGLYRKL